MATLTCRRPGDMDSTWVYVYYQIKEREIPLMLITLSRFTKTKLPYVCPLKQGFSIRIPFHQQAQCRRLHDFWPQFRLSCSNRDQYIIHSSEWAANILEILLDIFGDCKLDILVQKARKLKAKQGHVSGQV